MMERRAQETLQEFIARLKDAGIHGTKARPIVRRAMTSPTELVNVVRAAVTHRQIPLLNYIFSFSFDKEDIELVPVLCDIVEARDPSLGAEDAVEALGEIGDARAVPSLVGILLDAPDWDFDGYAGEKAVWGLATIGTDRAWAAIRMATTSPRRRVWQATIRRVIERPDPDLLLFLAQRLITEDPWSHYLEVVLPAVAEVGSLEAWRIIDEAAEFEDPDNQAIARKLLQRRGSTSVSGTSAS